jgi:molybdopterin converting factor small subunit
VKLILFTSLRNKLLLLLSIVLILGGWSSQSDPIKEMSLYKKIDEISSLLDENRWKDALEAADSLKTHYKKEKWKLQLLGDEYEYGDIDREISKLEVAVKEQDKVQCKLSLAAIRTNLDSIYSL